MNSENNETQNIIDKHKLWKKRVTCIAVSIGGCIAIVCLIIILINRKYITIS